MIDDHQLRMGSLDELMNRFNLARPQQGRRARRRNLHDIRMDNVQIDGAGQAFGLFQPRIVAALEFGLVLHAAMVIGLAIGKARRQNRYNDDCARGFSGGLTIIG